MKTKIKISFILLLFVYILSCSSKELNTTKIEEKSLEAQMIEVYNQAFKEFERGDVIYAGKKFNEVELLYPQSIWAPKANLMAAYGYFSQSYYSDAINELERFVTKYPNHPNIDYAFYLLALCHYDQIIDEKKDLNEIIKAQEYFNIVLKRYPKTAYADDSKFKLEFIHEIMASKEIYLARYYTDRGKWIPAINRFKKITDEYETTIYVEEALLRLVELHYKIGLVDEAKKYASVLGYNYQSSEWYEASYKILNKDYSKPKRKDERKKILDRFKTLFK